MGEKRIDARALQELIRRRYPAPQWLVLFEVRNDPRLATRRADAIAVSTDSRAGVEIHGFEIKASRADWLREVRMPQKSRDFSDYCDRWWLVASSSKILRESEVPPGWGLLLPRGERLISAREAPQLAGKPVERPFLAALLRRAIEESPHQERLREEFHRGLEEGQALQRRSVSLDTKLAERRADLLQRKILTFEEESGIPVEPWRGARIGQAVRLVLSGGMDQYRRRLERAEHSLGTLTERIREALEELGDEAVEEERAFLKELRAARSGD